MTMMSVEALASLSFGDSCIPSPLTPTYALQLAAALTPRGARDQNVMLITGLLTLSLLLWAKTVTFEPFYVNYFTHAQM